MRQDLGTLGRSRRRSTDKEVFGSERDEKYKKAPMVKRRAEAIARQE